MHVISPLYLITIPVNMLLRAQCENINFILLYFPLVDVYYYQFMISAPN